MILSKIDPETDRGKASPGREKAFVATSMSNVKRLHYLTDQISRTRHMLDLNSEVMKKLVRTSEQLGDRHPSAATNTGVEFRVIALSIIEECQVHYKSASSLLYRANSISLHVSKSLMIQSW